MTGPSDPDLDERLSEILEEELGEDLEDAPPEEIGYAIGLRVWEALEGAGPDAARIIDDEAFASFQAIDGHDERSPSVIDMMIAPIVLTTTLGRGARVAELAQLVGLHPREVQRLLQGPAGMFLAPTPFQPMRSVSLHARGIDGRHKYYGLNLENPFARPWPPPLDDIHAFMRGLFRGLRESLQLQPPPESAQAIKRAIILHLLESGVLVDLLEGMLLRMGRIARFAVENKWVPEGKTRDRLYKFYEAMNELPTHLPELRRGLDEARARIVA